MIARRALMGAAAALAAAPALAQRRGAGAPPVGLQLYTLRVPFAADPVATLERVAAIGYREVEYGGDEYAGMDPAMLRRATDRLGLRAPSVHVGLDALTDRFAATVAMARTLGADTLIVPSLDDRQRRTVAGARAIVMAMNRAARRLREEGLGFAYHNHEFEFAERPGGVSLYDRLVADTDPALVRFELDLFWATKAGQDPLALVRRLAGRLYAYHVKDMTSAGGMTSVGAGTIDFAAILRLDAGAGAGVGVRHFYVENDEPPAPYWPDVTASFTHLRRLLGAQGV